MTIQVERTEQGARFEVKIDPAGQSDAKSFTREIVVSDKQLGSFDRIGLERWGARSGNALFDSLEIRLGR